MFTGLDVETLALWNNKPVIKHHNLGTISEIVNEKLKSSNDKSVQKKISKDTYIDDVIPILIPALIEKINKINEI